MNFSLDDVVAALASAPGSAARGILRISGPETQNLVGRVFVPADIARWNSQQTSGRHPGHVAGTLPADVLLWPTNRSYTGQPLAEIHTVGSPPVLERLLSELFRHGVRPARAGEFTLRAFLAGRLDLMQAEAVLGVIDAEDHAELETALRQLGGGLSGLVAAVRGDLLDLLSDLEAGLDFVEEDIEFIERAELTARLARAAQTIGELSERAESRIQSTGRSRVVLAGLPNAGKSCLFNALAGEDAALVSDVKGTTRDVLRALADWQGVAVELFDTAGWEPAPSDLLKQADQLRREESRQADLIVYCTASDLDPADVALNRRLLSELEAQRLPLAFVRTKCDLAEPTFIGESSQPTSLPVSAKTGLGLAELLAHLTARLAETSRGQRQLIGTTSARCRESLLWAAEALHEALHAAEGSLGEELIAVEVRLALDHLGRILGAVYTDDVLDRIFSKFCIGK